MSSGKSEKRKEEEDNGDDLDREMQAKLVRRPPNPNPKTLQADGSFSIFVY